MGVEVVNLFFEMKKGSNKARESASFNKFIACLARETREAVVAMERRKC
jgi:hypothetical protein